VSQYGSDYSLLDTRGAGGFLSALTTALEGAGVEVESLLREANLGQHEVVLAFADALRVCDNHALAKFGAKQVAAADGLSLTFMAKLDSHEGNSCQVHFSLRDVDGDPVFAGSEEHGFSAVMASFLAGQLAYLPELTLLFAPNINSYKRFVEASYAPTAISRGMDNRTCALRVVGSGHSLRFEHRLPGADMNPHLVVAAPSALLDCEALPSSCRCPPRCRETRTGPHPRECRATCGWHWSCSDTARPRPRPSGPRSSTTTRAWPRSGSRSSTKASPTGRSSEASNGCRPACPMQANTSLDF